MYIKSDKVRIKRIVLDLHDVIADSKKFKKSITYINGLSVYACWVRSDCLKCAVLCYTFGRWEFELSTRKFMELKITKDLKSRDEIRSCFFGFCYPSISIMNTVEPRSIRRYYLAVIPY